MRALFLFVAIGSFTLLSGNWVNATFSIWSRSVPVGFANAELDAPGIYRIRLTIPVDQNRIFSSRIGLQDADHDKFLHTPKTKSVYAIGRGLYTIEKQHSLLIAQPTSGAPLPARGRGVLMFPLLIPSRIVGFAFFLLCLSSVALCCFLPFPTWKVNCLARRFVVLVTWCLRMLGRHPLVVLSLPSAYLLSVYPPLWKDVDALVQLILPASIGNTYHFPSLFCFGARLIVWLGDCFLTWKWPDLLGLQKPTLLGIYALVVAQHLALVLSLGLLCKVLTRREWLRGAFVVGFFFASSLYTNAHLCGSEAWSLCATIFLFAFGLRIYSDHGSRIINWIGYGSSLVLAIGSRHVNLLLGFWLIALYMIATFMRPRIGQPSELPPRPLLKAGLAVVLLAVALFSNSYLNRYIANWAGIEPRTTLGHTLSDRIDSFLAQIGPVERAKLGQELAATTSDHNARLAILDQATIGSFYKGTNVILEEQLKAEGFAGEHLQAVKDRAMIKATLAYLETLHPVLLRVIWKDCLKGFTETSNASLAEEPFAENSGVGRYRLDNPDLWNPLDELSSTFLPESVAWLDRSGTDAYLKGMTIKGLKHPQLGLILVITLLLIGLCLWNRRGMWNRAIPALLILLTGIGVFAATMICVYFMQRYALPLWVSILVALTLAIEGLFEGTEKPDKKGT